MEDLLILGQVILLYVVGGIAVSTVSALIVNYLSKGVEWCTL